MKRFIRITVLLISLAMFFSSTAYSACIGDVVNKALHTDIVARINDFDIPSYNVDGHTYIIAEELSKYGFYVSWDNGTRTLGISRNYSIGYIEPNYIKPYISVTQIGEKSHNILYTDINTYLDGEYVHSYNIDGQTIIRFDSLSKYGGISWNEEDRIISLVVPGLNMCPDYNIDRHMGIWFYELVPLGPSGGVDGLDLMKTGPRTARILMADMLTDITFIDENVAVTNRFGPYNEYQEKYVFTTDYYGRPMLEVDTVYADTWELSNKFIRAYRVRENFFN